MFDLKRFDEWVAVHDDDEEAVELSKVVLETLILSNALLGSEAAAAIGQQVIKTVMESAYGSLDAAEAQVHLDLGDPISAVEELFGYVDMLNFEFAHKANALKCYAMTGMIEGEEAIATFDEKKNHLFELISWGGTICDMVPEDRQGLPKFRSICTAAQARFCLDLNEPVDTMAFAHLASLFREGMPEQVRKTLQNQISAKQLDVNDRRDLLPESALSFLKGVSGFPSIWMLSEQPADEAHEVTEPTFIPVGPATFSRSEQPFLPSERHADGYHVGAGEAARTFDDYWEALDWLSQQPEPAFQPVGQELPVRCKPDWARVDRKLLINELAAVLTSGEASKSLTEQVHLRLLKNPAIRVHSLGHTTKLYRFQLENRLELAVEKLIGEPWLYLRQDAAPAVEGADYLDVPGTKQGRHHHLNAIPSFVGQPLRKFRLTSIADLDAIVSQL